MLKFCKTVLALAMCFGASVGCGPVPRPKDAYTDSSNLLADMDNLRRKVRSVRIMGKVDSFGERRVQGKIYIFAALPDKLRIELVSPFGNPLSVLTVNGSDFALHDLREGIFLYGPAEPCNVARLVYVPMPAADIISIVIGQTPIIEGQTQVTWNKTGYYAVEIKNGHRLQQLDIGPDKNTLPLQKSLLKDDGSTVFSIAYDRWSIVGGISFPHEIRVKMPGRGADLLLRYDADGVEINVDLPADAWTQTPPPGLTPKKVTCK